MYATKRVSALQEGFSPIIVLHSFETRLANKHNALNEKLPLADNTAQKYVISFCLIFIIGTRNDGKKGSKPAFDTLWKSPPPQSPARDDTHPCCVVPGGTYCFQDGHIRRFRYATPTVNKVMSLRDCPVYYESYATMDEFLAWFIG